MVSHVPVWIRPSSMRWLLIAAALVVASSISVRGGPISPSVEAAGTFAPGGVCLARASAEQLTELFANEPGGVIGADYQRATPLANGNVLWTFQDAEVRLPNGTSTLVHNIGMIQQGSCFTVLMSGSAADPQPWLFASSTAKFSHWYWPLGAEMGADGRVYVFLAEMFERGPGYLTRVEPASTVVAGIDVDTLEVEVTGSPGNPSAALYGFSIESDSRWTYLYAQCHRQFGFDPYIFVYAHDRSCSNRVTVGRVPKGEVFATPSYWSGRGWQSDPAAAVAVIGTEGRMVNASQIVLSNNNWMAITKVDDWWGDRILIEQSARPTGPFGVVGVITPVPKCAIDCNTYFASWIPSPDVGLLMYGLSHNRWDGVASGVYRPTFANIAAPGRIMSPADRCSFGLCG